MPEKAKMTYFTFHGLGEPVRFMMAYTGVEWTEELVEPKDFPKMKNTLPYAKLPLLEMDGMKMHQSAAIMRYLARKAGIYGKTEFDALLCDVAYDTISDLRMMMLSYFYEPDETSKAEKKKNVLENLTPMYMRNLEALVQKNKGYFVNGQLTWVDIAYGALITYMSFMAERDLVADKPALRKLRDLVLELPAIKKHVATRKKFVY